MKEILKTELNNHSVYASDIGKLIKNICDKNNHELASVNALLDDCLIEIKTNKENFCINYKYFNPVEQMFKF